MIAVPCRSAARNRALSAAPVFGSNSGPVMHREHAQVRPLRRQPRRNPLEVAVLAQHPGLPLSREQPAAAIPHRRNGNRRTARLEDMRPHRLIRVAPEPRPRPKPLHLPQMPQRLARARTAEIHRMIVRHRQHVDASRDKPPHMRRMRAEHEHLLARGNVVPVRYHRFEIGDHDIALKPRRNRARRVPDAHQRPPPEPARRRNPRPRPVEARISHQHDRQPLLRAHRQREQQQRKHYNSEYRLPHSPPGKQSPSTQPQVSSRRKPGSIGLTAPSGCLTCHHPSPPLRGGEADEAIQGRRTPSKRPLDCFAERVLGIAKGDTRGLAMTPTALRAPPPNLLSSARKQGSLIRKSTTVMEKDRTNADTSSTNRRMFP